MLKCFSWAICHVLTLTFIDKDMFSRGFDMFNPQYLFS